MLYPCTRSKFHSLDVMYYNTEELLLQLDGAAFVN